MFAGRLPSRTSPAISGRRVARIGSWSASRTSVAIASTTKAHYKGSESTGDKYARTYDLSLSPQDGYAGTCTVETTLDVGGQPDKQRYEIVIKPLAGNP